MNIRNIRAGCGRSVGAAQAAGSQAARRGGGGVPGGRRCDDADSCR